MAKIRVLTIDDSALMRQVLAELLSKDPSIEVIGSAPDPYVAREKIKALNPDVLTLDVEMPKMDGLTFLEKLMRGRPTPVIMVSSLTEAGCQTTLRALELGAVDFITKPKIDLREGMDQVAQDLIGKIKAAATASVRPTMASSSSTARPVALNSAMIKTTDMIIAIGSSTGGTEAVKDVLQVLPPNTPPILITQHMPERFTKTWADRMNQLCRISVKEAEDGDILRPGLALLAPGGKQMMIDGRGAVKILPGDERLNYKPCVDITFGSAAKTYGDKVLAVVLTGMGADGREGARLLKQGGSSIWAQDEASCVIYGMPMAIVKAELADAVYSLDDIGRHLVEACV